MIKLALGTAQFGLPYGINNQYGIPKDDELYKIFLLAKQFGISVLDSAQAYGNAEERIGELSNNRFQVITKFRNLESPFSLHKELKESLTKLRSASVYGYMAHDSNLLIDNPTWWEVLKEAKLKGLVKKIGYSLYSVNQLESLLLKQMIPDIIQFPFNVLDRRFEPYLPELFAMGVEIHTRSVYLQGLLHMDANKLSSNLKKLKPYLMQIKEIASKDGFTASQLCLGFALQNPFINKVVIGIDNSKQLIENITFYQNSKLPGVMVNELNSIDVKEKKLLNPANWN
jgi:aryl-alcohol dehydrogenase-like predicted oxidoreductase